MGTIYCCFIDPIFDCLAQLCDGKTFRVFVTELSDLDIGHVLGFVLPGRKFFAQAFVSAVREGSTDHI